NVVNFGNNCQGVEAAAQTYFNKSISDCSLAQCAAIAGITQNPSKWNPLVYPENNKIRRETVLSEMLSQDMISKEEYDSAMEESADLKFQKHSNSENDNTTTSKIQNWYIDELYYDLRNDLAENLNISLDAASAKIYSEGLKIYCAMDVEAQTLMEKTARNIDKSYDPGLQTAMVMMGYDGRVIATVGSSEKKDGNLLFDRATNSVLQPGSSIKPVVVYPLAIEQKKLNYSSMVDDSPYEKWQWKGTYWKAGPNNWYKGYKGKMLLADALEISSNATAVQTENTIGVLNAYQQVTTKMGFAHLDEDADSQNLGALSIGGMQGGVTVREMANAFTYLGNGGYNYKPYTYYYVTDNEDNIILDNRDNIPMQAYSQQTSAVMNRLLYYNVQNSHSTNAYLSRIDGWEIIGKTGTTDSDKASWFCGASPYATLACWTGFDSPKTITANGCKVAATSFQKVMSGYLKGKDKIKFSFPSSMKKVRYCKYTGKLASSGCYDTDVGYYFSDNMPEYCYGSHGGGNSKKIGKSDSDTENGGDNSSSSNQGESNNSASENSGGDSGENSGENSGNNSSQGEETSANGEENGTDE
ncbi:MAG: penicillin-binding transpeptidase domain-containing protein, partial [Acutalibacteraceae bacterium]